MPVFFKIVKKIIPVLAVSLSLTVSGFAQVDNDSVLGKQFLRYQEGRLQEKMFVHTDRDFYVAGEILWLKIYDADASFNKLLDISKIAYVELFDLSNKPVLQAKIAMKNGTGNGSFYLPVNLNSGTYRLRTYSNWMKNFNTDYFFEKPITIINTRKKTAVEIENKAAQLHIQFFPEGGNLVDNIQSILAFKATDENGKGLNSFTGFITDEKGDTLQRFSPFKLGMGHFDFLPVAGHRYQATIMTPAGKRTVSYLPDIAITGYTMHISRDNNKQVIVTVKTNDAAAGELSLLVHTRQCLQLVKTARLQKGVTQFIIDENQFGDGISCFTIFDGGRLPVCERLFFKYPDKKLVIESAPDQLVKEQRSKISFHIRTSDEKGQAQAANLSMAVYRIDSLQFAPVSDIQSYFWLESDLKGNIESASWYFEQQDSVRREALDNLLLTQGWRRFRWADVFSNNLLSPAYIPEYAGHIIRGKVTNIQTGSPEKDIECYCSVPGIINRFAVGISDSNGIIQFEMPEMIGSSTIILQAKPQNDKTCRIEVDNPFVKPSASMPIAKRSLISQYPNTILDQSISMQVQNIYAADKLNQPVFSIPDTTAFYTTPTSVYLLDNYTRFTTMEEVLREYVANMVVRKNNGDFNLFLFDFAANQLFDHKPLILLDGVPVFDSNKMMRWDPLTIKKLEMVNARYFSGNSYFDGIMSFSSYSGSLPGLELDAQSLVAAYEGMQEQREFYSPVYENEQQILSHVPDFRNLLYWSPAVTTDSSGKNSISFYSSDLPGKYIAVIQGTSSTGAYGIVTSLFEVR